ncbi:uncharacterized protein LOC106639927 [Copidosoma floridanum]|uniref:uncharacterized protein LOC106639927 n=1 Tax=Copidosoma floridanum TaxID=29053 RepID=UPI0006C96A22|nr:uncharacterized protein LOC106639927 [Copidosoma floridanum]
MAYHQLNIQPIIKCGSNTFSPSIDAQLTHCADFEMRLSDCLDVYGIEKGMKKCEDLLSDLRECLLNPKQRQRVKLMREQHILQYKKGERKEMFSKPPAYDAY